MNPWTKKFIELAIEAGALKFGEFVLKSGRHSPYFFNAGAFFDGRTLEGVANCYADAIVDSGTEFDLLFGPAYKGIPLAATVAASLYRNHGLDRPMAYNRKEAKDHGEGGLLVGAPIAGRILVVDDVISAGTAFEACRMQVEAAGGHITGLVVGLDRQERGREGREPALDTLRQQGIEVKAVARLDDLVAALQNRGDSNPEILSAMLDYRSRYGLGGLA